MAIYIYMPRDISGTGDTGTALHGKARHANDGTRKARKINTIKHQYNKQEQYIKNNKIFFGGRAGRMGVLRVRGCARHGYTGGV